MTRQATMTAQDLKRAYQLVSEVGRKDRSEIRDTARNNVVVYSGTYAACVREAKRMGIWYS